MDRKTRSTGRLAGGRVHLVASGLGHEVALADEVGLFGLSGGRLGLGSRGGLLLFES